MVHFSPSSEEEAACHILEKPTVLVDQSVKTMMKNVVGKLFKTNTK